MEAQYATIVLYSVGNRVSAREHPLERSIREAAFVFLVAAADIGVIAGKPDLLEREIARIVTRGAAVGHAPFDAGKILSVLVDRDGVLGIRNIEVQVGVVEGMLPLGREVKCSKSFPE